MSEHYTKPISCTFAVLKRIMTLWQRWKALAERIGLAAPQPAFQVIEGRYAKDPDWYHTLRHIEACLNELDLARHLASSLDAVELALWFHDIVYDPRANDNEEQSAALLRRTIEFPIVDIAVPFILATKHAEPPSDPDALLTVDVDLSILGKSDEEFDAYERAIRVEYQWVPEDDYRAGRTRVLQSFLERSRIYSTAFFADRYEEQARRNLARSLSKLS